MISVQIIMWPANRQYLRYLKFGCNEPVNTPFQILRNKIIHVTFRIETIFWNSFFAHTVTLKKSKIQYNVPAKGQPWGTFANLGAMSPFRTFWYFETKRSWHVTFRIENNIWESFFAHALDNCKKSNISPPNLGQPSGTFAKFGCNEPVNTPFHILRNEWITFRM